MTLLLTVLGAVLFSLMASSEIVPQADFSLQQVAGKWYLIGFASNAKWFVSRKTSMKMGWTMVNPSADGDLEMSYRSLNSDGSCFRLNTHAKMTDMPGKFTYTSRWGDVNDMRWVDVKYDEYALVHINKTRPGVTTVVNKLYGRQADLSADLLEKFRQFSLEAGILPENISFLPKNAECSPA